MKFTRSRITFALICLLLVGGASAVVAVVTTPHPEQRTLANTRQDSFAATATASSVTASSSPTTTPLSQPTATATTPPPPPQPTKATTLIAGQTVDINGKVTSVDNTSQTFTMTWQGATVKIDVTGATAYSGDAKSLNAIRVGWFAEVHGVVRGNGYILASEVNASSGN